jgi:hypothetical protein
VCLRAWQGVMAVPRVLFFATHPSAPLEYSLIAKKLIALDADPTICLATPRALENVPDDCRDGLAYCELTGALIDWSKSGQTSVPRLSKAGGVLRQLRGLLVSVTLITFLLSMYRLLKSLYSEKRDISKLFGIVRPHILVLSGDRQPRLEATAAQCGKEFGCAVICIPACQIAAPETLALRRLPVPRGPLRFLNMHYWSARFFPSQVYEGQHKTVNFYNPYVLLLLKVFGVLPRHPWQMGGGGRVSALIVHGRADKDIQRTAGLAAEKILDLGQPSTDIIYQQITDIYDGDDFTKIRQKFFHQERRLAIFAIPQPFSDAPNWTSDSLLSVVDSLIHKKYNVCLSVHPKQPTHKYQFLERKGYAALVNTPLVRYLGLADLYVASFSSTIRWAMLMGVPLCVLDYHAENSPLFLGQAEVPIFQTSQMLEDWLSDLEDTGFRARVRNTLQSKANYYQHCDGKSADRIARKLIELYERNKRCT